MDKYERPGKWAVQWVSEFGMYQETVFSNDSRIITWIVRMLKGRNHRVRRLHR